MARIPCNGVELEYEWVGPPEGAPLLLVPGHEGQLIWWHEGLCEQLVAHGFRLLRYDNRDSGLSTHMDDRPAPDLRAAAEGDHSSLPYTLADLADDAAALLQALGVDSAHLLGHVMGGMVAQLIAIRHPERARSLCFISAGAHQGIHGDIPFDSLADRLRLPQDRARHIEERLARNRAAASKGFALDDEADRVLMGDIYDRSGFDADAYVREELRKIGAILSAGDRRPGLGKLRIPAAVLQGDVDPLTPLEVGREAAAAIPGAEFVFVKGLGHDLPAGVWPLIARTVQRTARRVSDTA